MTNEAVLVDLSAVCHQVYHATANDPNPNATSIGALDIIRRVTMGQPHVAICADSQTSLRRQEDPTYKANRPKEDRAPLYHQMDLVIDGLRADGFPVWSADGYEADDVIASATKAAVEAGWNVRIITRDKDLLALVSEGVTVDGSPLDSKATRYDRQSVFDKFGVWPYQFTDFLCLTGDASDNIKGADGIGPVRAAGLLKAHATLEGIQKEWAKSPAPFTDGIMKSLTEFWPRVDDVRKMLALRFPPVPFEEIRAARVPKAQAVQACDLADIMPNTEQESVGEALAASLAQSLKQDERAGQLATKENGGAAIVEPERAIARQADVLPAAPPAEWEKQLEPRSMDEARMLAKFAFDSRLFGAYGSPQAVLMTVMAGRDFGMSAMASLRAFHVVSGKPVLAADAIRALVLRSGKVKFFRCAERTAEKCTFISQRHEDDQPTSVTYTIEDAKAAGLVKPGSQWTKGPADMLVARASAKLARLVAPEVTFGIYAPEEFD